MELCLVVTVETTEYQKMGVKLCKRRCAQPAVGPCRNGRTWASAVTNSR
jgi:hypothetical protein